ncbi:hypothetical protein MPER_07247 [Moniliophthora perniciosa FA553]|nr:hypothetical protein MPER_07247 [Moniliophthora perniciosa FA553]
MSEESSKEWILEAETEYRFELDPGTSLAITLVRGDAEIFGAEMVEGKAYLFGKECKAAVFTWIGCTLKMSPRHITGQPSTEYVSEETPMTAYGNLHIAFEQMRVRALRKIRGSPDPDGGRGADTDPPRVLVLGPENSGKTTLCKTLINYAVRAGQGWSPLLVNVDPSEARTPFYLHLTLTDLASPGCMGSSWGSVGCTCTQPAPNLVSDIPIGLRCFLCPN